MKKILVLSYSQSGQTTEIVTSITKPLQLDQSLQIMQIIIKPHSPYPFPWGIDEFFEVFPESVMDIPCTLQPLGLRKNEKYDLIIFAYQPWYLSPSIPAQSFFHTPEAQRLINNTPVITVISTRNMWIMAQEDIKSKIYGLGGRLVGNIALKDRAFNLISVITIVKWMLSGKKTRYWKIFPLPGVAARDIANAECFGEIIRQKLINNDLNNLQNTLIQNNAVPIDPLHMLIEKRAKFFFKKWAQATLKKGEYKNPRRKCILKLFKYYLLFALYIVSPIVTIIFYLLYPFTRCKLKQLVHFYQHCQMKDAAQHSTEL